MLTSAVRSMVSQSLGSFGFESVGLSLALTSLTEVGAIEKSILLCAHLPMGSVPFSFPSGYYRVLHTGLLSICWESTRLR